MTEQTLLLLFELDNYLDQKSCSIRHSRFVVLEFHFWSRKYCFASLNWIHTLSNGCGWTAFNCDVIPFKNTVKSGFSCCSCVNTLAIKARKKLCEKKDKMQFEIHANSVWFLISPHTRFVCQLGNGIHRFCMGQFSVSESGLSTTSLCLCWVNAEYKKVQPQWKSTPHGFHAFNVHYIQHSMPLSLSLFFSFFRFFTQLFDASARKINDKRELTTLQCMTCNGMQMLMQMHRLSVVTIAA